MGITYGFIEKVVLEYWLKGIIPRTRMQHDLKGFEFQCDNGEFNSKACRDLIADSGGVLITN